MKNIIITFCLLCILGQAYAQGPGALSKGRYAWRSAVLPGWGQFYNKNPKSGLFFSGATLLGVGGFIFAESQRTSNIRLRDQTSLTTLKRTYSDKVKKWETTRNLIGVATIAVYVGNIIHAATAKSNLYAHNADRKFDIYVCSTAEYEGLGLRMKIGQSK